MVASDLPGEPGYAVGIEADGRGEPMMKPTILLVDDEPTVGDFLGDFLVAQEYEVKTVMQPQRCLDEVTRRKYDMLVTDLCMQGMDGLELVKKVQEIQPDILCILITGYGTMDSMRAAMRLGVNDYLVKPCTLEDLKSSIEVAFEHKANNSAESSAQMMGNAWRS